MTTTWDPSTAPGDCTFGSGNTVFTGLQGYGESCYANTAFPASSKRYIEFTCSGDDILIGLADAAGWNAYANLGSTTVSVGYGTGGGNSGIIYLNGAWNQGGLGGASHTHTTGVSVDSTGANSIVRIYRDGAQIGSDVTLSGNPTVFPAATSYGSQAVTLNPNATPPSGYTAFDASSAILGSAAQTLAAVTQTAAGSIPGLFRPSGALATRPIAYRPLATGSFLPTLAFATATQTVGAITNAATGAVLVLAASSKTLSAFTNASTGVVPVAGSATQTVAAVTQAATGVLPVLATQAATLGNITQVATAKTPTSEILASSDVTLGAVTQAASGAVLVLGAANQNIAAVTQAGTGLVLYPALAASADQTVGPVTNATAGTSLILGSASQTIGAVVSVGRLAIVGWAPNAPPTSSWIPNAGSNGDWTVVPLPSTDDWTEAA
jgi:hypothetical protein